ncbi:MAG: DUF4124 domain-containing protein [Gammaproteobacteria bacterium]|jgi:hypothetical protein
MKKTILIILGIAVVAGYMGYQDPMVRSWFQRQTHKVLPASASEQTLYRWQDHHGEWHVSDKPPAGGIQYQTVRYPTNANVIPSSELTGKK